MVPENVNGAAAQTPLNHGDKKFTHIHVEFAPAGWAPVCCFNNQDVAFHDGCVVNAEVAAVDNPYSASILNQHLRCAQNVVGFEQGYLFVAEQEGFAVL